MARVTMTKCILHVQNLPVFSFTKSGENEMKKKVPGAKSKSKESPEDNWAGKLRVAFNEVCSSNACTLTLEQWLGSKLPSIISDTPMDESEMKDFFNRVDADCDQKISWNDLVEYLLKHGASFRLQASTEKRLKITFEAPDEQTMMKCHKTATNLRMLCLQTQGQILTLSESTLTFWRASDCVAIHTITDKDGFLDCCIVPSIAKVAVAKANRQIIFIDIRSFEPMRMVISASAIVSDIPKMTEEESERAVTTGKACDLPMFNKPRAIIAHPEANILFVGDEEGRIEVLRLFMSRNARHGWTWERINVRKMHCDSISQITYLEEKDGVFVSASLDGSLVVWKYRIAENTFSKLYKFRNSEKLPITSFAYDQRTKDIVYTTPAHYFGIWRTFTQQYEHIETLREIVTTLTIVPLSDDASFCVTLSKDNFVSIYRMPNMTPLASYCMGIQHSLCPPTFALYVKNYLYLAGAFLSKWKCDDCTNEGLSAHSSPILRTLYNDVFDRLISIDQSGAIHVWTIENGNKTFSTSLAEGVLKVTSIALDSSQRRMAIGYSDGLVRIVAASSGTVLATIDKQFCDGECSSIAFASIMDSRRLFCCSNQKIVMFEEMSGNRVNFVRNFVGHSEILSKIVILKDKFILSIGSGSEMFLWNVSQQHPICKFHLDADTSTALDIPEDQDLFIIGDVVGNAHVMSLTKPTPIKSIPGSGLTTQSAITAMAWDSHKNLYIGNMHGYVKLYKYNNGQFLVGIRFRAHTEAILSISVPDKHEVLITAGRDEEIKIWRTEPFALIGNFGHVWRWNLSEPSSCLSNEPLPDDPNHFADLKAVQNKTKQQREEDEKDEAEGSSVREQVSVPVFSLDDFEAAVANVEDICVSGRRYVKLAMSDDVPLTSRPMRPSFLRDPSLVDKKMMTQTLKLFRHIKAKPKIWKPLSS